MKTLPRLEALSLDRAIASRNAMLILPHPILHRPPKRFCLPVIAVLFAFLIVPAMATIAHGAADPAGKILTAAESLFEHMAKRNYPALWGGLSDATQRSIVRSVGQAEARVGREAGAGEILADFETGGPLARSYWDAYMEQFDPKAILEESRWSMGAVRKDSAEIVLRYRKSRHDAILKLYYEHGTWRVGLDESFSTRQ